MAPPILEVRHLFQSFPASGSGTIEILHDINLEIRERDFVAILGPSGCGKSTLLRAIIGLEPPTSGEILYRGQRQAGLNSSAGLVFQNFALFPWLTVYQNIEAGMLQLGLDDAIRNERLRRVVHMVGLAGSEEAFPKELSGGMKQRVGLARALAVEPEMLFMDEPFSALDALTSETLRNEVIDLYSSKDSPVNTVLMVTHSISEAVFMASRLVVMGAHPGAIRAVIDNPLPYPRDEHHPDFVARIEQVHSLITQVVLPDKPAPTSPPTTGRLTIQSIPNVSLSTAVGLLEILENEGNLELYELTNHIDMDLGQLLLVVKAAELLHWVTTPGGKVEMADAGRKFLAAGVQARKRLLNASLRELFIFDLVIRILQAAPGGRVDESVVLSQLALTFPHERPGRLMRTLIAWARYAELFKYSSGQRIFYGLDRPPAATH